MPLLNPGAVLNSAYLSDDLVIIQRAEVIGLNGRGTLTETRVPSWGTTCAVSDNDLARVPEAATAKRLMSFVSNNQIRPIADGSQPDLIEWPVGGAQWVVLDVQPYPAYGIGWYQVIVASQDMTDVPL